MCFLGYLFNKKGYTVVELATEKRYYTRDVIFVKSEFSFVKHQIELDNSGMFPFSSQLSSDSVDTPTSSSQSNLIDSHSTEPPVHSSTTDIVPQRPTRNMIISSRLKDYTGLPSVILTNLQAHSANMAPGTSHIPYPLHNFASFSNFKYSFFLIFGCYHTNTHTIYFQTRCY